MQKRLLDSIREAIESHKCTDVVVLSCFNGTGGATFLQRLQDMYIAYVQPTTDQGDDDPQAHVPLAERFVGARIVGDEPWMHDSRVVDWCVDMAGSCLQCRRGLVRGQGGELFAV